MVEETFNYKREITHTQYRHGDKKVKRGRLGGILFNVITDNKFVLNKNLKEKNYYWHANDKFWSMPEGGGFFLFLFIAGILIMLRPSSNKIEIGVVILTLLFFLGFVFFVVYYYTMPKKEFILNREDGLMTWPGFMWHKNITMPIDKVIFSMSGPGVQGLGAFELIIERPDWFYSKYQSTLGNDCYEDLSFYLWYMDKNRPLPPGTAFDPYRQRDFERRKAEGFPKPLFPAEIPTPEATPEQQAERERIGGW